jgi:hypothetical protein
MAQIGAAARDEQTGQAPIFRGDWPLWAYISLGAVVGVTLLALIWFVALGR